MDCIRVTPKAISCENDKETFCSIKGEWLQICWWTIKFSRRNLLHRVRGQDNATCIMLAKGELSVSLLYSLDIILGARQDKGTHTVRTGLIPPWRDPDRHEGIHIIVKGHRLHELDVAVIEGSTRLIQKSATVHDPEPFSSTFHSHKLSS
jgi:hypothetical protein